jgi:hypothetical protein
MNTLPARRFLTVDRSTFLRPFHSFCIIGDWVANPEEFLENGIFGNFNFSGLATMGKLPKNCAPSSNEAKTRLFRQLT